MELVYCIETTMEQASVAGRLCHNPGSCCAHGLLHRRYQCALGGKLCSKRILIQSCNSIFGCFILAADEDLVQSDGA